jgi:hypothetical protein
MDASCGWSSTTWFLINVSATDNGVDLTVVESPEGEGAEVASQRTLLLGEEELVLVLVAFL